MASLAARLRAEPVPALSVVWLRKSVLAAVWVLAFSVPLRQVVTVPGIGTVTRALGLVVMPLALLAVAAGRQVRRLTEAQILPTLLVIWAALSYFWSIEPDRSMISLMTAAQLLGLVWLVWEFGRTRQECRFLLSAFVLGAYLIALSTSVQYVTGSQDLRRYTPTSGIQPNSVAFILSLAVPISWYLAETSRPKVIKLFMGLYSAVALFAIVLTGSRGGLLTTAVALLIIPASAKAMSTKGKSLVAAGVTACALLMVAVVPALPVQRLATTFSELQEGNFNNRRELWRSAYSAFGERPAGGLGIGTSRVWIRNETGREDGAHNSYLSIAAELGAVGLALFGLWLLSVPALTALSRGPERKLAWVLWATLVLGLFPRHWEFDKPTWLVLALLVSLLSSSPSSGGNTGAPDLQPAWRA